MLMLVLIKISSDSNKNNRARTITCIQTSSSLNSSNSTISTTNIRFICKDNQHKNPSLTFSDSIVLQPRRLQWLKVTILVNMRAPEVTAVSNTYNKATVVVG